MRCPKCHYLSFEPESRCRNCGYDYSLSVDLATKPVATMAPAFDEIELQGLGRPSTMEPITLGPMSLDASESREMESAGAVAVAEPPMRRREHRPVRPAPQPRPAPVAVPMPTSELPLFVRGLRTAPIDHEETVLAVPPAPPPLAVRRSTPDPASLRQKYRSADVDLFLTAERSEPSERLERTVAEAPVSTPVVGPAPAMAATEPDAVVVSVSDRITAATLDGLLLAVINFAVVWFTLRLCGLTFHELGVLPLLPMLGFFLLIDAGYLILFTAASGQTVGKMAAGIRVVGSAAEGGHGSGLTLAQATWRALLTFPSVLVLGAGFLPILIGAGRALHDRVAETRVVRA